VTGRGESQSHSRLIAEIFEEGDRILSNHDYRLQDETARISDQRHSVTSSASVHLSAKVVLEVIPKRV